MLNFTKPSKLLQTLSLAMLFGFSTATLAEVNLRPYVLAHQSTGDMATKLTETKTKLTEQGFEIVGQYSPYTGAEILIVTNKEANTLAGQSKFGGYGAAQRVALTAVDGQIQVSYTHPEWMANVYRMKSSMQNVADDLSAALGAEKTFGSQEGKTAKSLKKYRYMMMMPYFDDPIELATYANQEAALEAVNAGLSAGKGGTKKVYQIDIDGKNESVFGVAIMSGDSSDEAIMKKIDEAVLKQTAHLPYEVLVSDGKVYMLHGKFRIAQSFPDLTMGSFMGISGAPADIEKALSAAVN